MKPKTKEELLDLIESLPNDFEWFSTKENDYNCIDMKIFTKPNNEEFYDEYFGF